MIRRSTSEHSLEVKRIKGEGIQKDIKVARRVILHNVNIFIGFPTKSSGEGRKFYYINSKGEKLQEKS
jgi:hypothetical protein